MKALITALTASVALAGCAPLDMSVFVEGAAFLSPQCTRQGDINLIGGTLDIGPAAAFGTLPRYFGFFGMRSDLQSIETISGDDIIAGNSRNEFVATTVILTYATASGTPIGTNVREPIYFVIRPETDSNFVLFNMLNAASAQALSGAVAPGGADQLLVTFQFEGNVRSAGNSLLPMHTPPVTFPIDVFNTPTTLPTCMAPSVPIINGPCGNSQETYVVTCS